MMSELSYLLCRFILNGNSAKLLRSGSIKINAMSIICMNHIIILLIINKLMGEKSVQAQPFSIQNGTETG